MLYELALSTLGAVGGEVPSSFMSGFPAKSALSVVELKPAVLPIVSSVPDVGKTAPATVAIVQAIKDVYKHQQWRQPYKVDDFGADFFHGTAWFPIADLEGPIVYSQGLMEIMLLGANVTYPGHKHVPEELYVILAGQVWWESEEEEACWKYAGEVIHHPSNVVHSLRAGDEPVLILNLWRGGGFEMPVIN